MPFPNDEEWERATTEAHEVATKHQNDPFIMDLLIAVYNELERQYKEGRRQTCE